MNFEMSSVILVARITELIKKYYCICTGGMWPNRPQFKAYVSHYDRKTTVNKLKTGGWSGGEPYGFIESV